MSLYNRGLTAAEVNAIYAAGSAGKCPGTPGPVSIAIANPSFELLTGTDTNHFDADGHLLPYHHSEFPGYPIDDAGFFSSNAIPGWSGHASSGTINYLGTQYMTNGLTGTNCAWINVTGEFTQTLADTFQAGQLYRLSVDVGYPLTVGFPGYVIALYANGQVVAADTNSVAVVAGDMKTVTLEVTLPAGSPFIGAPIEIHLGVPDHTPDQTVFDNVRLTAQPTGLVSLTIANPSFELLTGTDTNHFDANGHLLPYHGSEFPGYPIAPTSFFSADAIPGWSGHASSGTVNYLGTQYITNGLTGTNCAWINVTGEFTQTLADKFQAGQVYRLSVDVGWPLTVGFSGYVIGLYANGQVVAADTNSVTIVAGDLKTATVEVTLPAGSPFIGAPIEIRLGVPDHTPDETVFDNVRLTAQSLGGTVTPTAPTIVVAPVDTTVLAGRDATFSVIASGTGPLSFQWQFKGDNIASATNSTLVVPAVRKNAAGSYSVTVCNALGCTPAVSANLTVTPVAAAVSIVNATAQSPGTVEVPVRLIGNGVENAVSFSLRFDTNRLTYLETSLGSDAAAGQMLVNSSQTAKGILAVILALPAGSVFADGTNDVLHLTFGVPLLPADTGVPLTVTDNPTVRKVSDASGSTLPATWTGGILSIIAANYEGDVSPLPNGDKQLDITDWVQVGRYVAGLDDVPAGPIFQRADCAPLASGGNGVLSVSDWVQAGRFAVGLDALVAAGGPTGAPNGPTRKRPVPQSSPTRVASFVSTSLVAGLTQEIPVTLVTSGEENAIAFSVSYDPAVLAFVGAVKGSGSGNAVLNVNSRHTDSGEVGLALALTTGAKFPAGTIQIARLQFRALASGSAVTNLAFTDAPIVREVASPLAEPLDASWQVSSFSVALPSVNVRAVTTVDGPAIELSWSAALTGATLEQADSPTSGSWSPVALTPTVSNGQNTVVVPRSAAAAYFHVKLP